MTKEEQLKLVFIKILESYLLEGKAYTIEEVVNELLTEVKIRTKI